MTGKSEITFILLMITNNVAYGSHALWMYFLWPVGSLLHVTTRWKIKLLNKTEIINSREIFFFVFKLMHWQHCSMKRSILCLTILYINGHYIFIEENIITMVL